jgi:predicted nucleic acid-binding protein
LLPPDEIAAVLAMFHNQGELFQPDVSGPVSSDPADTKFLHCAQAAQADYIVTGNKRHFSGRALWRDASLECR